MRLGRHFDVKPGEVDLEIRTTRHTPTSSRAMAMTTLFGVFPRAMGRRHRPVRRC
jgi:hypothetical protein